PVPLVEAAVHDLVAERRERHGRELVVGALGLLHRQNVDVGALQPNGDAVDPGADRIDVPGSQAHAPYSRSCARTYREWWCTRKPIDAYNARAAVFSTTTWT